MKNIKSRVYPDTILQTALKDILIPILMGRDTSRPFGDYTREIEDLKDRVTALEIPDKSKLYRHSGLSTSIYVALPEKAYKTDEAFYEPVLVEIDCEVMKESGRKSIEVGILIPANYNHDSSYGKEPTIVFCNQTARDILGTVVVKAKKSSSLNPSNVYEIYFPKANDSSIVGVSDVIVTIASENRNVEKDTVWTKENSANATTIAQTEMILGMVAIEPPIPNRDKLVYSDNVRSLLSITKGAFKYVQDTEQTVPTTLYFAREDKGSRGQGRLYIRNNNEIKTNYSVLVNIFGKDWSGLEFEFSDDITDISEVFQGLDITHTPKALIGKNVSTADRLFKGSRITRIANQETLLKNMPRLRSGIEMFADCSALTGEIKKSIIKSNVHLTIIDFMFKNTKITNAEPLWQMTHIYQPPRDPMLRPDDPDPLPITQYISGRGCFEGVNTLVNISDVPEFWKTNSTHFIYRNKEEFIQLRQHILKTFNNNLSTITIEFKGVDGEPINLDSIFTSSTITHSPKKIITVGESAVNMFAYCNKLISVSETIISGSPNIRNISGFVMYCDELTTLPQTLLYSNKSISNYSYAFAGLTSITGDTPKGESGVPLWELAGKAGYPPTINGENCFRGSSFDNMSSVPSSWKGGN